MEGSAFVRGESGKEDRKYPYIEVTSERENKPKLVEFI